MGKNKWEKFHSTHGITEIDKPRTAGPNTNLRLDWYRAAENLSGHRRIFINGVPVSHFAKKFNNFATKDDVGNFFAAVVLKDMEAVTETEMAVMVEFLKNTFHQGGLMYPVSAPFAFALKTNASDELPFANINSSDMDFNVNIQTTSTGFKVQEITRVKSLLASPFAVDELVEGEREDGQQYTILPDPGNHYIVKLQGALDINFSQNRAQPAITVESNSVSYGNKAIQNKIDKRDLGEIIVDFFRYIFGMSDINIQYFSDKIAGDEQGLVDNQPEGQEVLNSVCCN